MGSHERDGRARAAFRSGWRRPRLLALGPLVLAVSLIAASGAPALAPPAAEAAAGCRIYVASGDDVPNGHELNDDSKRYPERLLEDHLKSPGWCVYNQGKNGQTSASYISAGGLASAYTMRPDLLTIQLGEQNDTIVKLIKDCFDKVKDHDFSEANACAAQILANQSLFDSLRSNYTTILQQTRIMAAQRPQLVIAVVNYPNPYPQAADVADEIVQLCVPLIDTIPTCTVRWAQLPPALLTIDQVFQKLNQTLKDAMAPFQQGPNGSRWVYVDVYPKFKGHCMTMKVQIKTTVEHPEELGAPHQHDSPEVNFGCSPTWFVEGSTGTKIPQYLDPAAIGVLVNKSQTTKGMGVYPNADGHKCIDDAIWEADTIKPGTDPLKWLLAYGEPSNANICQ
jgi:lysophospholipase L1-like esterase